MCPFACASRENAGDMKTGVCRREGTTMLLAEEKTHHKHPVNPKNYRKNPSFNAETEVSIRRKRISNLSVLLHCFGAKRMIKLVVIMTPLCLIKLREHLYKTEF